VRKRGVGVSGTKLFARTDGTTQFLIYAMAVDAPSDVAMILPLPIAPAADDALTFIELQKKKARGLFGQLARLFTPDRLDEGAGGASGSTPQSDTLTVHHVGSFEASFVPSLADMSRLDPQFRIADEIWQQLPQHQRSGFAVFKLREGAGRVHPMAMRFKTAEPTSLFFPTVHLHDGRLRRGARFDHTLYFQTAKSPTAQLPAGARSAIEQARLPVADHVSLSGMCGILAEDQPMFRVELSGAFANVDTRIALA
jgi:hypothetical protein